MTQKTAEEIHVYDMEKEEDNEVCNSTDDEEPMNTFAPQTSCNEQEVKDPVTSHKISFKKIAEPFWMTLGYGDRLWKRIERVINMILRLD
ncbi:hypothetical protein KY290_030965 [Solanum tuberosum]|uniref:Uncharacterized protein n=1 Tax=Solanum tuberosum TaxID=4113 RepID=A0ABQ7U7T4_SOLTU|nr:hypothetical protein KY290_030965 [Solanum tuberosum]